MKYLLLLCLGILVPACVRVATLDMSGNPKKSSPISVMDTTAKEDEQFIFEVNAMKNFFSCDKDSLEVKYFYRMLEVSIDNPIGQCFGIYFDPRSINENALISFKAKYEGSDTLDFVAGFTDTKGGKCEDYNQIQSISSVQKGFISYRFDYSGLLAGSEHTLDLDQVQTVVIYLNTKGRSNIRGLLTIKEINID